MSLRGRTRVLLAAAAVLCFGGAAQGFMIGFDGVTLNSQQNTTAGEAQLWLDVTAPAAGQAAFTFYNIGPVSSFISQIFVEQGPLRDLVDIDSSSGVSFSEGGSPKSLPGGNALSPSFETAFRATAGNSQAVNGVNNGPAVGGEYVTLVFDLQAGTTYDTVLAALQSGDLRVGMHVQGFCNGGSEGFVNIPPIYVPEPATAVMNVAGLLTAMGYMGHRRRLWIRTR